jgi:hypothetical protein
MKAWKPGGSTVQPTVTTQRPAAKVGSSSYEKIKNGYQPKPGSTAPVKPTVSAPAAKAAPKYNDRGQKLDERGQVDWKTAVQAENERVTKEGAGVGRALGGSLVSGFYSMGADLADWVMGNIQVAQKNAKDYKNSDNRGKGEAIANRYAGFDMKGTTGAAGIDEQKRRSQEILRRPDDNDTSKIAEARRDLQFAKQGVQVNTDLENESKPIQYIGQGLQSLPITLASRLGPAGMALTGIASFKSSYDQKFDEMTASGKEIDPDKLMTYAMGAAAVEVGSEFLFPAGKSAAKVGYGVLKRTTAKNVFAEGVTKVAKWLAKDGDDIIIPTAKAFGKSLAIESAQEGAEEVLSYVGQGILAKLLTNPDDEWSQLINKEGAFQSFMGGAVAGLMFSGVAATPGFVQSRQWLNQNTTKKIKDLSDEDIREIFKLASEDYATPQGQQGLKGGLLRAAAKTQSTGQVVQDPESGDSFEVLKPTEDGKITLLDQDGGSDIDLTVEEFQQSMENGILTELQPATQATPANDTNMAVNDSNLPVGQMTAQDPAAVAPSAAVNTSDRAPQMAGVATAQITERVLANGETRRQAETQVVDPATGNPVANVQAYQTKGKVTILVSRQGDLTPKRFEFDPDSYPQDVDPAIAINEATNGALGKHGRDNIPQGAQGAFYDAVSNAAMSVIADNQQRIETDRQAKEAEQAAKEQAKDQPQQEPKPSDADLFTKEELAEAKAANYKDMGREVALGMVEQADFEALRSVNEDMDKLGINGYLRPVKTKNHTPIMKEIQQILDDVAGKRVVFVQSVGDDRVNEFVNDFSKDTVFVNIAGRDFTDALFAVGHGLHHLMVKDGNGNALTKAVTKYLGQDTIDQYVAEFESESYRERLQNSADLAVEEIVADRCGEMFKSSKFWRALSDASTSKKRAKMFDAIAGYLDRVGEVSTTLDSEIAAFQKAINQYQDEALREEMAEEVEKGYNLIGGTDNENIYSGATRDNNPVSSEARFQQGTIGENGSSDVGRSTRRVQHEPDGSNGIRPETAGRTEEVPSLIFSRPSSENFHKAISEAVKNNLHGAFVEVKPLEEYQSENIKLFLTPDSGIGFAIKDDGDLVSFFKNPNKTNLKASQNILLAGLENGATKLDCFDGRLRRAYSEAGFVAAARTSFKDDVAPDNWNYERDGRPDIIFMVHNGDDINTVRKMYGVYELQDISDIPLVDYETAIRLQTEANDKIRMYSGQNKRSLATTPSESKLFSHTSETLSGTAPSSNVAPGNEGVKPTKYSMTAEERAKKIREHRANRLIDDKYMSQALQSEIKDYAKYYYRQSNDDTMKLAMDKLMSDYERAITDALDITKAGAINTYIRQMMIELYDGKGDAIEAARWFTVLNKANLEQGQGVQANVIIDKLSFSGNMAWALQEIEAAISKPKKKVIEAKTIAVTKAIHDLDIDAARQALADKQSLMDELMQLTDELERKERALKRLEERIKKYQDELGEFDADAVKAFIDTLHSVASVTQPFDKLPKTSDPVAFMKWVLKNVDSLHDSWLSAYRIVRNMHGNDDVFMGEIDAYFGEFMPDSRFKHPTPTLDLTPENYDKIRNAVIAHYSEDFRTFEAMVYELQRLGLDMQNAVLVARMAQKQIADLTREEKRLAIKKILPSSKKNMDELINKIINLSNEKGLQNEEVAAYVAHAMGLPGLTPELVNLISENSREIANIKRGVLDEGRTSMSYEEERFIKIKKAEIVAAVGRMKKTDFWRKMDLTESISLMSNPKTIIRNIVGNTGFAVLDTGKDATAAGIDMLISKITGKREIPMPEIKAMGKGFKRGGQESYYDITHGIDTSTLDTAYSVPRADPYTSKAMQTVFKGFRLAMQMPDRAFQSAAFDSHLLGLMKLKGITDPGKVTQDMIEAAQYAASYKTFTDENYMNKILGTMRWLLNAGQGWGIGSVVLKFTHVPASILMRTIDYSPVSLVKALYYLGKPMYDAKVNKTSFGDEFKQGKFAVSLANGTYGSAITIGLGALLAGLGLLTGKSDDDQDKRALNNAMGIGRGYMMNWSGLWRLLTSMDVDQAQPQAGDLWSTYSWFSPMNIGIGMGANIVQDVKNAEDENMDLGEYIRSTGWTSVTSSVESITEMSVLSGINRYMTNVAYGDDWITALLRVGASVPSNFVPQAVKGVRELFDNTMRDTYDTDIADYVVKLMKNKVPGMSKWLAPAEPDALGNLREVYQNNGNNVWNVFFNPAIVSRYQPNADAVMVLNTIMDAEEAGLDKKNIVANRVEKVLNLKDGGAPVKLTDKERYNLTVMIRKEVLKRWSREISPNWTLERKYEEMNKIMSKISREIRIGYQAYRNAQIAKGQ